MSTTHFTFSTALLSHLSSHLSFQDLLRRLLTNHVLGNVFTARAEKRISHTSGNPYEGMSNPEGGAETLAQHAVLGTIPKIIESRRDAEECWERSSHFRLARWHRHFWLSVACPRTIVQAEQLRSGHLQMGARPPPGGVASNALGILLAWKRCWIVLRAKCQKVGRRPAFFLLSAPTISRFGIN